MQTLQARTEGLWKDCSQWWGSRKSQVNGWRVLGLEDALASLEEGVLPQPSVEDFARILHSCRKKRDRLNALRLHAHMRRSGLEAHTSLGNYLVSLMVEVGSMRYAQQVFDRLIHPNEGSWNSLITGYVRCGEPQHALILYEKMQRDGSVHASGHAFVALLKACAKLKNLERGLEIHAEVSRMGLLKTDVFVGSTLIDMYAKCGSLAKAQQVFEKLSVRNVVSWNALIAGYAEHGLGEEALNCFEQMQLEGVSANDVTFVCSLKACGNTRSIDKGQEIHAEIERKGLLERNLFVGSTLVDMYAKCGSFVKAQQVFNKLPVRDVVSWTALIAGYAEHGHGKEALEYFEQMQLEGVCPNAVTFVCSLKACGSIGATNKGQEIHAEIERKGLIERNPFVGSTLVDMYAKCGLLAKALQVFDKLPVRDIVSWTALIAGYAEHGHGEEALKCFEQMQLEGVSVDANAFACSLKACGSIGAIDKGGDIHSEIERRGLLERDLVIGNTLVDMYAKCGSLAKAQQVFDKLRVRDVVSWNALMAGYAEHGHGEEVLKCFEQMLLEGVSPDAVTFVCNLKACGSIGATEKGQEIHAEVERKGLLERNLSVGSMLVYMYAKCGLVGEAQQVFDKLPVRDIVSWNALIAGYVEQGHGEEALKYFEQLQLEGVSPDDVTVVCSLKACGTIGAICKGQEIHAEIERNGLLEKNPYVCSTLVDMYAKCGFLAKAQQAFEKLPFHDIVLWNTLIAGYTGHGHSEEALKCFDQMQLEGVPPDAVSFVCSLKSCSSIRATDKGQEIHAMIETMGLLERDLIVGNSLVGMYAECGSFAKALQVFDKLPVRDVVSWNSLITGYAEHGHCEKVLKCFEQMQLEGVSPDDVTFVASLKSCGSIGVTEKGREIHTEIERKGLQEKNVFVGSTLVDMYAKCGLLATARQVFDKLPVRDVVLWNTLITGYAELGYGDEAVKYIERMQLEGVSPNAVTFVCSLKACGSIGATDKGQEIHSEIVRKGLLERDLVVGNTLVDMYAKCGSLAIAQEVFDKLLVRDIVSWNSIIAGYAQLGESENVFHIFDRLLGEGVKPDPATFVIVLNACSRTGLVNKSEMYLEAMSKDYGIAPTFEHHTCMLDLLGRVGQLEKAVAMIKKMPFCANLVVWHSMMSACKNWGNVKLGKQAFEHAVHLDEKDAAAYVLMSHIYAGRSKQD